MKSGSTLGCAIDASLRELLTLPHAHWMMSLDERVALEGILVSMKPSLAIEIGSARGGSLERISMHSTVVHSFDLVRHPDVTAERFPNVTFHVGDSHELLTAVLNELVAAGAAVDFALVDGDHSAHGVRRDLEDLLASPSTGNTVVLVHDTVNERVRAGLEEIAWHTFENVCFVDTDFLTGRLFRNGPFKDELWGGFALVITGGMYEDVMRLDTYKAPDVLDAFLTARSRGEASRRPRYHEIASLERQVADLRNSITTILGSRSWRLTTPLRRADQLMQRIVRRP
jgi:hypothetical protein